MYQVSPMNWMLIFFSFIILFFHVFFLLGIFEIYFFPIKLMKKIYVK